MHLPTTLFRSSGKMHIEHGGMIDFHNTFAPVVNWSTVRLIIIMAEIAGWESRQIDYVLALSLAPSDSDVFPFFYQQIGLIC